MTPDQLADWAAVAIIDGWYQGDWTHTAHLLSTIHNSAISQLAADGKISRSKLEKHMIDPQEYIEANVAPRKQRRRGAMTPSQLAERLKKADKWPAKRS